MRISHAAALLLCAALALSATAYADDYLESSKLYKQGDYGPALDKVNVYLGAYPKDVKGRFLKGLILGEQKKYAESIKIFAELADDNPELPEPYNNLAVLYAAQGEYEKARNALEMAIHTHPSYATAHQNLGEIYAKLASQAYDKALQLDRNNTAAQVKLTLLKDLIAKPAKPLTIAHNETAKLEAPKPERPKVVTLPAEPSKPALTAAKSPGTMVNADNEAVLQTVYAWAQAWSDNDVTGYLAFYAKDFKAPGGNRSAWEKTRKERIAKPKKIAVSALSPKVRWDDTNHATVSFRQSYRSGSLKTQTGKTLVLVRNNGKWLIQQERIGK